MVGDSNIAARNGIDYCDSREGGAEGECVCKRCSAIRKAYPHLGSILANLAEAIQDDQVPIFLSPMLLAARQHLLRMARAQFVEPGTYAKDSPLTARIVPHVEATAIATRFCNSHFNNPPPAEHARVSIPANPERDDDLLLFAYIRQREAEEDRAAEFTRHMADKVAQLTEAVDRLEGKK